MAGSLRAIRRTMAAPTAFERKMQKKLRKQTGTDIRFRLRASDPITADEEEGDK